MQMDSKTQRKWQPICRHLRFWISKDAKSRRVLEQIATLCPPFRGSRSFLSVLGKQFFHSNISWTGWHIWWHWQRGKMSAKVSVFRISAAPGSSEWTQWHWLEGKLVHDKDISVSAPDCCQSKENHLHGKFQQGKIFWNLNCRKYVARTRSWLLTKPLLVSFTPKIFRLPIQATKFEQPAVQWRKILWDFLFQNGWDKILLEGWLLFSYFWFISQMVSSPSHLHGLAKWQNGFIWLMKCLTTLNLNRICFSRTLWYIWQ